MKKIVVAGGTGLIGQSLISHFGGAYKLTILSRGAWEQEGIIVQRWDGQSAGAWIEALEGADALINLAGLSINRRFSEQNKRQLLQSRLMSTRALGEAMISLQEPPKVWLNASGIHASIEVEGQSSFLEKMSKRWEAEALRFLSPNYRLILARISPVLHPHQGVFAKLHQICRWGLGGKQGPGDQCLPWIHYHDLCRIFAMSIEDNRVQGSINICSPEQVNNREFMATLRKVSSRSFGLPSPSFILKMASYLGAPDSSLVLQGIKARPKKLLELGFRFDFPTLESAFQDLIAD